MLAWGHANVGDQRKNCVKMLMRCPDQEKWEGKTLKIGVRREREEVGIDYGIWDEKTMEVRS